ncbi:hypothetical protein OS493_008863 [Desmophyllum pertusum]|uniref:Uncharacterized protein n=1 Tax=Desmophyllum pertusum TaxID=174260 RepID=A0A9W9ZF71_9CNID|nr:hypothetical protein OS493_008863 [Desmophyllum pertusum]
MREHSTEFFVLEGRTSKRQTLGQITYFPIIFFAFGILVGTAYWQAEGNGGILLMSAYCIYTVSSPLFLSAILMAHLNKALNIFHLERADGCGRSYENVIQNIRANCCCVRDSCYSVFCYVILHGDDVI